MKQKIVIKVDMHCNKCRKKALTIAAKQDGVTSVALEGPEKDKVVVIGEGVDAASLTLYLGKKLHHASLELVEEVKPKSDPPKPQPICEICKSILCARPNFCMSSYPPVPTYAAVPCDISGPTCIIM